MRSSEDANAIIYFVGVGPGSPGLLTVRAADCLKRADIILYEDDLDPGILLFANPKSQSFLIGTDISFKEVASSLHKWSKQVSTIARLSVGAGFDSAQLVDEISDCIGHGISVEVVPGLDKCMAAASMAGHPLLKEGAGLRLISTDDSQDIAGIRTLTLGESHQLDDAVAVCFSDGLSPDTSAVFISSPGNARRTVISGSLSSIISLVDAEANDKNGVLIVGADSSLAEKMQVLVQKPLGKERIVITRAAHQSAELTRRLEELGAEVMPIPTIELGDPSDTGIIDQVVGELRQGDRFDWLIFTSANGVSYFFDYLAKNDIDIRVFAGCRIAVIGPATEKALLRHGLIADIVPGDYVAEGLLKSLGAEDLEAKRILIPRALEAREILPEVLKRRGANVTVAPIYETRLPEKLAPGASEVLQSGTITMVTFTSSSTVVNWLEIINRLDICSDHLMRNVRTACIGPVTADTARKLGLSVDIEAPEHTIEGLVKAILDSWSV